MGQVMIVDDASDAQIAAWVEARLEAALDAGGPVAIAVPGGSTPFPILALLADRPLDWRRMTVWPTDDRAVPEDHPASNAGRIRALLAPTGAEVISLTVMEQVPHFALTWLGMGADGHVASLFPGSDPRADDPQSVRRITPEPLPPEAPFDRITLTIPALIDCDALMFVVRGPEKRAVFDSAAAGEGDMPAARLIAAATGEVTCFT
jgi:6-phosphogluconolactonase